MTEPQLKFAIWAAVSTAEQARPGHYSLPVQIERCAEVGKTRGWEQVGAYIADGYSRTKYVDLSTAEKEIPALGELIRDGKAGRFDLVLMVNYNRLRDLRPLVSRALSSYRVQLASLAQWTEPQDPAQYRPYDQGQIIMSGMADIISQTEIANLRQHHAEKMPQRVLLSGLAPRAPYGYTYAGRKEPHVQVRLECEALVAAKDLLLDGASLREICTQLTANGYPPAGGTIWYPASLVRMLRNPYYYGLVTYQKVRRTYDPHDPQIVTVEPTPERMVQARGVHEPIWDEETYQKIIHTLDELIHPHTAHHTPLTGLAFCGVCGYRMTPNLDAKRTRRALRCRATGHDRGSHPVIEWGRALGMLSSELQLLVLRDEKPAEPAQEATGEEQALQERRTRLVDALELGVLDANTYHERVSKIDAELAQIKSKTEYAKLEQIHDAQRRAALEYLRTHIDEIPTWLRNDAPRRVNRVLGLLLTKIIFFKDRVELVEK